MESLKTDLPTPFSFSQSSLQDYSDCNRRFQLRYIEQLRWPAVETAPVLENERLQLEGQQFHRMIQQYLVGQPLEKLARTAAASDSADLARWWENFSAALGKNLSKLAGGRNYPEHSLSVPLGNHRLVAKYDLINVQDGRAVIFDWKTSQKRPADTRMAERLQTRVYLCLLAAAGAHLNGGKPFAPGDIEMVYWYADYPDEPARFSYNDARRGREWENLESLMHEIAARQSFPLTSDEKKCGFCSYRSFCERGVTAQAGGELEPEDEPAPSIDLEQIQEIEF